jgi:hypothetical protein
MIPLTRNEIAHLAAAVIIPPGRDVRQAIALRGRMDLSSYDRLFPS